MNFGGTTGGFGAAKPGGGFGATTGLGGGFGTTGGFGTSTTGTTGGFGTAGGVGGGFGTTGGLGGGTLGGGFGGLGATTGLGGLSSGLTAQQQDNVVVTGETVFTQLPVAMQQKIWEVYQRMLDHRRNADVIKKFSTQPTDLDDQTKKLKLDIMRVQNAQAEIAAAAEELRRDVDRLRSYVQQVQSGEHQAPYQVSMRAMQEQWQHQKDTQGRILEEVVEGFEGRLSSYDTHIQELYRKLMPGREGEDYHQRGGGLGQRHRVTPPQLAALIRMQRDAFMKVAGQVAVVHEMVERLRSEWDSRTGQDPFEELDRLAAEEEERKKKASRLATGGIDPLTGTNMFQLGNTTPTQGQPGVGQPGAFGQPQQQQQQQPATSLFGGTGSALGGFGAAPTTTAATNLFGGLQQPQQQLGQAPSFGVGGDLGAGTRTTRGAQGKNTRARR